MGLFDDLNGLLGGISEAAGNVAGVVNAINGTGSSSSSGGALGTIVVPPPPSFEELISNIGFGFPPQSPPQMGPPAPAPAPVATSSGANVVPLVAAGVLVFFLTRGR